MNGDSRLATPSIQLLLPFDRNRSNARPHQNSTTLPSCSLPKQSRFRGRHLLSRRPGRRCRGQCLFQRHPGQPHFENGPGRRRDDIRADSGRTNGNTFEQQGRLISCEGAEKARRPAPSRSHQHADGQIEVLTERYEGKRYNSPNES